METNGGAKLCTYCEQTYTQYNEPIYIVCVCENIPRYAHGSCFRNWLGKYEYGVCKMCLSKTKLIPDGWKSIVEVNKVMIMCVNIFTQHFHKDFFLFHTLNF